MNDVPPPASLVGQAILIRVREELLAEARQSPGLLADLANLEGYVAETYSARSFIELLQNADDASAQRFVVTQSDRWVICANDGYPFSYQDFYSLCRSASSAKRRGQSIGFRGIGFKSVVGIASAVHLFSGDLRATFSRALTKSSIGADSPAPLIRIPHEMALDSSESVLAEVESLQKSGLDTVFVLDGLDSNRVQEEFEQFDADYLLFLRHIREAVLNYQGRKTYTCDRKPTSSGVRDVSITGPSRRSNWRIHGVKECDLAFSLDSGEPVALTISEAIAHAYLPTQEPTGFGIRINADFSTDPSRTRIILDGTTTARMDEAADAIARLVAEATLAGERGAKIRSALTPTVELATLSLQKKTFRTELITRVTARLSTLKDQVALAPTWLNKADANKLSAHLKTNVLPQQFGLAVAQTTFLRYIGIPVISTKTVAEAMCQISPTVFGCAELLAQTTRDLNMGVPLRTLIEQPIWWVASLPSPIELDQAVKSKVAFSTDFVGAIAAAGLMPSELARLLSSAELTQDAIDILLPTLCKTGSAEPKADVSVREKQPDSSPNKLDIFFSDGIVLPTRHASTAPITSQSLPAWRGAEQYVAQVLQESGYAVEDRSRQNLGYDLLANKGSTKHYIEVKLLDYAGQPFIITTNEEAVARECGDDYVIAMALRSSTAVHVQFIRNPVRNMKFVRQCRQWVWECSEYEFTPTQLVNNKS